MQLEQGDIFHNPSGGTFRIDAIAFPVIEIPQSHWLNWESRNAETLRSIILYSDCPRTLQSVVYLGEPSSYVLIAYQPIEEVPKRSQEAKWFLPAEKFLDGRFERGIKPGTRLPFCNVPTGAPFVFADKIWGDRTTKPSMHFGDRAYFDYFTGNCCGTVLDWTVPVLTVHAQVIKP